MTNFLWLLVPCMCPLGGFRSGDGSGAVRLVATTLPGRSAPAYALAAVLHLCRFHPLPIVSMRFHLCL
jgi:hypothetical protein